MIELMLLLGYTLIGEIKMTVDLLEVKQTYPIYGAMLLSVVSLGWLLVKFTIEEYKRFASLDDVHGEY